MCFQNTTMKKFLQIGFCAVVILFGVFLNRSYAATLIQQPLSTNSQTISADNSHSFMQGLGQTLAGYSVTGVQVWAKYNQSGIGLSMQECTNSDYGTTGSCSGSVSHSFTGTFNSSNTKVLNSFTIAAFVPSATKYLYIIYGGTGASFAHTIYGSATDVFSGGTCYKMGSGANVQCTGMSDTSFFVTGSLPAIGFISPTDGSAVTDFNNWSVSVGGSASNGDLFTVAYSFQSTTSTSCGVKCKDSAGTTYPQFADNLSGSFTLTNGYRGGEVPAAWNGVGNAVLVPKLQTLTVGNFYYAIVTRFNSAGVFQEQSSLISFAVTDGGYNVFANPDSYFAISSSTLASLQASLDTDCSNASSSIVSIFNASGTLQAVSCVFQRSANYALNLFILPHAWSKNVLSQQYEDFKGVFPFSIFFGLTDKFNAAVQDASSSPAQTLTYTWETPQLTSVNGSTTVASSTDSITFSNSTTLSDLLGRDVVILIFNAILLIAICVMMYLVYRIFFHH